MTFLKKILQINKFFNLHNCLYFKGRPYAHQIGKKGLFGSLKDAVSGIFGASKDNKSSSSKTPEQSRSASKPKEAKDKKANTSKADVTEIDTSAKTVYKDSVPEEYIPTEDIYEVDISQDEISHISETELGYKKGASLSEEAMNAIKAMKEKEQGKG